MKPFKNFFLILIVCICACIGIGLHSCQNQENDDPIQYGSGSSSVKITYPFGKATTLSATADADSVATADIWNTMTILDLDSLTHITTLNLSIDPGTKVGSILVIRSRSGAVAKALVAGTGLDFPNVSGSINKGKQVMCVYDGTNFVVTGVELYN